MTFTLTIDCGNAAFEPDTGTEVARILAHVAGQMLNPDYAEVDMAIIRDVNGNTVGRWEFKP